MYWFSNDGDKQILACKSAGSNAKEKIKLVDTDGNNVQFYTSKKRYCKLNTQTKEIDCDKDEGEAFEKVKTPDDGIFAFKCVNQKFMARGGNSAIYCNADRIVDEAKFRVIL